MDHNSNMIEALLNGNAIAESIRTESKESKGIVTREFIDMKIGIVKLPSPREFCGW